MFEIPINTISTSCIKRVNTSYVCIILLPCMRTVLFSDTITHYVITSNVNIIFSNSFIENDIAI